MQLIDDIYKTKKNKSALLVGGGMSVLDFDFSTVNRNIIDIISLNDALYYNNGYRPKPDYMIYSDASFCRVLKKMDMTGVKVIGNINASSPKQNYSFDQVKLDHRIRDEYNVAVKALFILQNMGYHEIYLIGIDLKAHVINGQTRSHHQGDRVGLGDKYTDLSALNHHVKRLNAFIEQFNIAQFMNNVYNIYRESNLKIFPFRELPQNYKIEELKNAV